MKIEFDDEYGDLDASGDTFNIPTFELENGTQLNDVRIKYQTYGQLNKNKDNVMVICHALTGNAQVRSWWGGLLGPDNIFNTSKYFVVCANVLGSCYGTTGPKSINRKTNRPYGSDFPHVTVRDTVKLHKQLLVDCLDIKQVQTVIGGSLGGMQALEWAFFGPNFVKSIITIACGSHHSAWQIGISELQRQAIYMDENWAKGQYYLSNPPQQGLSLARKIAMISYRTHKAYKDKYGRKQVQDSDSDMFAVQSYLKYQGEKFLPRFDANSYITLTELMDSHDVGRNRGGIQKALSTIIQPALIIGIDSDVLYPVTEQEELHQLLPNSTFHIVNSDHGHDGFLLEQEQIGRAISTFLSNLDQ